MRAQKITEKLYKNYSYYNIQVLDVIERQISYNLS